MRAARVAAHLSQAHVARVAGLSQSGVSRTERNRRGRLGVAELAAHCAALGLRLSLKAYPDGSPVRDAGHLRLLGRLRAITDARFSWHPEEPVGADGDLRAWDAVLRGPASIGVDAETALRDIQAVQRRIELKWRDSGVLRVVLLVAATRHNRRVLREHAATLAASFPLESTRVVEALRSGRDPGANGIVVL
jgi:transcriptional regulator with XRE-family HTH domain